MAKRKTIDEQLRDAVRGSGLSHYRVGKDAGLSPFTIDRFVAGREPRLLTAARIAEAVGMELVLVPKSERP